MGEESPSLQPRPRPYNHAHSYEWAFLYNPPSWVFRYPYCGCSDAVPATPGLAQPTRPEMQNTTTLTVAVFCINDFEKLSDKSYARFFVIGEQRIMR